MKSCKNIFASLLLTYFTTIFCLKSNVISAQNNFLYKGSAISYINIDSNRLAISQRPVTNREYIIYLEWLNHTYGADYPDIYLNSFPGLKKDTIIAICKKRNDYNGNIWYESDSVLKYSEPFVTEYMFNPQYIDFPVIGVSWQNANNYCKWLSDRYNENKLIKQGYLEFNTSNYNENCFTTESYLYRQYIGIPKKEFRLKWQDHFFIPAFRLPTKKELTFAKELNTITSEFKAYPFTKNNFLYLWYKAFFVSIDDTSYTLAHFPCQYPSTIHRSKTTIAPISNSNWKELYFDINNKNQTSDLMEIYKQNNQNQVSEQFYNNLYKNDSLNYRSTRFYKGDDNKFIKIPKKDSLGCLPFIIINEDKNRKPILIEKYKSEKSYNNTGFQHSYFRFVCPIRED